MIFKYVMAMYREHAWSSIQVYEALLVSACERKKIDNISSNFFCLLYVDLFDICQVAQCLKSLQ